jgi:hypothetical protein
MKAISITHELSLMKILSIISIYHVAALVLAYLDVGSALFDALSFLAPFTPQLKVFFWDAVGVAGFFHFFQMKARRAGEKVELLYKYTAGVLILSSFAAYALNEGIAQLTGMKPNTALWFVTGFFTPPLLYWAMDFAITFSYSAKSHAKVASDKVKDIIKKK